MLRPHFSITCTMAAMLLAAGALAAQHKADNEVTITKCWEFPIANVSDVATDGKDVFLAAPDGKVIAVAATGQKLWETDLGGQVGPELRILNGALLVTTEGEKKRPEARRLSLATGVPAEGTSGAGDTPPPAASASLPPNATATVVAGDSTVFGDDHGLVVSLSPSGSTAWKFKTGGSIFAVVTTGDTFLVLSRDNFVYLLNADNGGLRWKKRLQGRPDHYAISDKYMLISALDQHGASLIDLSSGRLVGQVALGAEADVITDPVILGNSFVVTTDRGVSRFSLGGCEAK